MSNYHTQALAGADVFTIMGSIYAEVARYDSALESNQIELARQAAARAEDIVESVSELQQLNKGQKMEIQTFSDVFKDKVEKTKKSGLDDYLLPFAIAARMRQLQ